MLHSPSKSILQSGKPNTAPKRLIDPEPSRTSLHKQQQRLKMQGVKVSGEPPKPNAKELESESAKQMRKAGFDRAQAEDWQKKGVMEKIQATTFHIKDVAAAKMDQLAGATTTTSTK